MEKTFMTKQLILTKRYKETGKLRTGQGEDYTTCYIKNIPKIIIK